MAVTPEILEQIANNPNFEDKTLLTEITELFVDRPEAAEYLHLYGELCEISDDMVDETTTPDMVDKFRRIQMSINESVYWKKWQHCLFLVERLIHNTYFDSVKWESASEEWKRKDAKAMSHCAYNMLFAVMIIEFGYDKMSELSLRFREHAHLRHIND